MDPTEKPTKLRTVGRPPKAPEKGKRRNYAFRMSDLTRDRVIASAERRQCSMSEEIERRVEMSFNYDSIDESVNDAFMRYMRVFFGSYNEPIFMAVMAASWQRAIASADRAYKDQDPWYIHDLKKRVIVDEIKRVAQSVVNDAAHAAKNRVEQDAKAIPFGTPPQNS